MTKIPLFSKQCYPKEETLPPKIEDYVPMDRRHDEFYEKFMEQRIQKINNREQSGMENSRISYRTSSYSSGYTSAKSSQ